MASKDLSMDMIRDMARKLSGDLRKTFTGKMTGLGQFISTAEIEKRVAIGQEKIPEPTKTGPRARRKPPRDTKNTRKAKKRRDALRAEMQRGVFFLRRYSYEQEEEVKDPWGIHPTRKTRVPRVGTCRLAKIVDGDLWIRKTHASVEDNDPTEWAKAKNAKPERLNQEIRQVAGYLASGEMHEDAAQQLLDLLFMHLGDKVQ